MTNMQKHVEAMIAKAAAAEDGNEAMKFSQAALNTANAMCSLKVAAATEKQVDT
jgi:hypothetical protein